MNIKLPSFKEISVVVQGPVDMNYTPRTLKSIRRVLPGATIILSTWEGSDTAGLDHDVLIENKDPGQAMLGGRPANYLRQIVSTLNGLKSAETKYAIKLRSDMGLKHAGFLKYFMEFNAVPTDKNYKVLKERIAIFTTHNPRRNFKNPFHVSDWFFFGSTEDLIDVFDIPLAASEKISSAEQYIWLSFLSKHKNLPENTTEPTPDNIELSEIYFANNCILLSSRRAGVISLKYPGRGYTQIPALSDAGYYTFTEYEKMLNKYAGAKLSVIANPFEEILYSVVYNLRMFAKTKIRKAFPRVFALLREVVKK